MAGPHRAVAAATDIARRHPARPATQPAAHAAGAATRAGLAPCAAAVLKEAKYGDRQDLARQGQRCRSDRRANALCTSRGGGPAIDRGLPCGPGVACLTTPPCVDGGPVWRLGGSALLDQLCPPSGPSTAISDGGPLLRGELAPCGQPAPAPVLPGEAVGHGAGPGGPKLDALFGTIGLRGTGLPMTMPSRLFPRACPPRRLLERRTRHVVTMAMMSSTASPPTAAATICSRALQSLDAAFTARVRTAKSGTAAWPDLAAGPTSVFEPRPDVGPTAEVAGPGGAPTLASGTGVPRQTHVRDVMIGPATHMPRPQLAPRRARRTRRSSPRRRTSSAG